MGGHCQPSSPEPDERRNARPVSPCAPSKGSCSPRCPRRSSVGYARTSPPAQAAAIANSLATRLDEERGISC